MTAPDDGLTPQAREQVERIRAAASDAGVGTGADEAGDPADGLADESDGGVGVDEEEAADGDRGFLFEVEGCGGDVEIVVGDCVHAGGWEEIEGEFFCNACDPAVSFVLPFDGFAGDGRGHFFGANGFGIMRYGI